MSEDGVFPIFYTEPEQDHVATREAGRAIFKDVEMVRIMIPGDRNNIGVYPVDDTHRKRWPTQYAAFVEHGKNTAVEGTRLEEWPYISRSRVMELKSMNIHTIEQLANVADGFVTNFGPGGADLVAHAKATVASDPMGVTGVKAIKERDEYKERLDGAQSEIDDLKRQIAAMQEKQPAMPAVQDNPPAMPQMPGVTNT